MAAWMHLRAECAASGSSWARGQLHGRHFITCLRHGGRRSSSPCACA